LEDDPNDPDFDEDRSLVDYTNPMLYQIYAENISLFSDNFNEIFFEELESSDNVKDLTELLIRDVNELWKFMYFMFRCLRSVAVDKECFLKVVEIIMIYS
jgi:L-rhamnose mutarotase